MVAVFADDLEAALGGKFSQVVKLSLQVPVGRTYTGVQGGSSHTFSSSSFFFIERLVEMGFACWQNGHRLGCPWLRTVAKGWLSQQKASIPRCSSKVYVLENIIRFMLRS